MSTDTGTTPDDVVDDQLDDDHDDGASPNREAQTQRARRREAEAARDAAVAERDTLAARVLAMQRSEVERLAGRHLADGADVWLDGTDLDALLVDGEVSPAAVTAAARAIVERRGSRFARPSGAYDGGADRGARPSPPPATWATVLTPGYRDAVAQGRR